MSNLLKKILNHQIIVFGTGQLCEQFCSELWFANIECFVDNDNQKWGRNFHGRLINDPEVLLKVYFPESQSNSKIVIASMYYTDIAAQLDDMGFVAGRDYFDAKELLFQLRGKQKYPPGHFYSTIPDLDELKKSATELFDVHEDKIPGISLNLEQQLSLLNIFAKKYYPEQPFEINKPSQINRYYFDNNFFGYCDGITLYCMLRHLKPKKVVEIGSGFSSAVMLDTNELFFENEIQLTFIEPFPDRLMSLLMEKDKSSAKIIERRVQDVDLALFSELQAGDILFIDSSHVAKIDSDVNYIVFNLLPLIKKGVYIHFHDIFYPFIYPENWVFDGRFWNEAYLLRAFLQYNNNFSISFWPQYINYVDKKHLQKSMPLCQEDLGASFWLEKIAD